MEAAPSAQRKAIVVSESMPLVVRLILGGVGAGGTVILLVELGPGLWPPTLSTLFFGFIVLGGLSVTLAALATAALAPNQRWEIHPGRLIITYELFNRISVKTYRRSDLAGAEVREISHSESADTYHVACHLRSGRIVQTGLESTAYLIAILAFLRTPIRSLRKRTFTETSLKSPAFAKREDAEHALAQLMTR